MRYAVVDLSEMGDATQGKKYPGQLLAAFQTMDSAKALALQRMAYGDMSVVVIDTSTGHQVFPGAEGPPRSGKPVSRSGVRVAVQPAPNDSASRDKTKR